VLPSDWVEPGFAEITDVAAGSQEAENVRTAAATPAPARERSSEQLQQDQPLAFFDPLTGLLNRSRFQALLESALLHAQVTDSGLAIVQFEIDKFRTVNAQLGHLAADEVLQIIAGRLKQRFRRGDLVARLGNAEFVVLLPGLDLLNAARDAQQVASGCLDGLQQPIPTQGGLIDVIINIRVGCYPTDGDTFDTLTTATDNRTHSNGS
jgi:diguanylate cyclase (GGDEF)-like protein